MSEAPPNSSLIIFVVGAIIVVNIFIKSCCEKLRIPALVGYMVLGFLLAAGDAQIGLLSAQNRDILVFLADIGVIALLFRIGLESNIHGLIKQLRSASIIWVVNVALSGLAGFAAAYYLLRLELIPSLFTGIALTATSVGISVAAWKDAGRLSSPEGELLLDVAELDDISSIMLMAVLFGVVPVLRSGSNDELFAQLLVQIGFIAAKLICFGAICLLAARYLEKKITGFFGTMNSYIEPMLTVLGTGFIIAALAGFLDFSLAIGAFFAGLIFSLDKRAVKIDASFDSLYELFAPFFFIGIGLHIDPHSLTAAGGIGLLLLAAAIVGKVAGVAAPCLLSTGGAGAVVLGISMIPRAEIAMVVMQRGLAMGVWAVPGELYSAMVLICAVTCLASPIVVKKSISRLPSSGSAEPKGEHNA